MSALPSASLTTPMEIYDTALSFFPCTRLTPSGSSIDLSLGSRIESLRISSAVDRLNFLQCIAELAFKSMRAMPTPARLDAKSFTLASPLTLDWAQFQRTIYARNVRPCEDLIRESLAQPLDRFSKEMDALGFLPAQVEKEIMAGGRPETLRLFRSAIAGIPPNDPRIAVCRERYPRTLLQIATDFMAEQMSRPVDGPYEVILKRLGGQVIGQPHAVSSLAAVLTRTGAGDNSVFLFVGPSGVGKTELAKAVASLRNNRIIRFDMNQFNDAHSSTTLFGSAAGLVGSTDKPRLAKELERFPEAINKVDSGNVTVTGVVILLDEFEKGHSTLRQSFLTLFDEGHCTICYTESYSNVSIKYTLSDCIIIGTSNLCKDEIVNAFQRGLSPEEIEKTFKASNQLLQRNPLANSYSDELLGRMSVIPFGPIPNGEPYRRLLNVKLTSFISKMTKEIGCKIETENHTKLLESLEAHLYGNGTDIRRVERYFKRVLDTATSQKSRWGCLEHVKITLFTQRPLSMRISTFSPYMAAYIPTPGIPEYPV